MGKESKVPAAKETTEQSAKRKEWFKEVNEAGLHRAAGETSWEAEKSLREGGASRASYISFLMEQNEYAGTPISVSQAVEEYDKNIYPFLSAQLEKMRKQTSLVKKGEGLTAIDNTGETYTPGGYYLGGTKEIKLEKGMGVGEMRGIMRHEYGHGRDPTLLSGETWAGETVLSRLRNKLNIRPYYDIEIPKEADYSQKDYQEMFSKAGWTNLNNLHTTFPNLARRPSRMHMNSTEIIATVIGLRGWLGSARESQPLFTSEDIKSIREAGTLPMPSGPEEVFSELKLLLERNPETTDQKAADSFNKIIGFKDGPRTTEQKV